MYIKSARITNIRSIEDFEINFENPAGWHVLIGDNGSGKSTIIRSLALALVGPDEAPGLRADWRDWLNVGKNEGRIKLEIDPVNSFLDNSEIRNPRTDIYFEIERLDLIEAPAVVRISSNNTRGLPSDDILFSVAYGPYRRFSGGNHEWNDVFANQPKLGAHLSAFSESVALTEPIKWLQDLNYQELEFVMEGVILREQDSEYFKKWYSILENVKKLINSPNFLPNRTKLESVSSKGVFFKDGNGNQITIDQLSDGYRSILSLTLELIRQLVKNFGPQLVFHNILNGSEDKMYIGLPGVVLIDEIDAHLHPTWQTKIGQWFTKYFPNLQFIVTTHSPLVCRAAIKGTIWKLAEPGSNEKSKEITGIDRDRLIYGNLVEAYGTGAFEEDVSPSENSEKMRKELADLSKKSFKGIITDSEKEKMNRIKEILPAS